MVTDYTISMPISEEEFEEMASIIKDVATPIAYNWTVEHNGIIYIINLNRPKGIWVSVYKFGRLRKYISLNDFIEILGDKAEKVIFNLDLIKKHYNCP